MKKVRSSIVENNHLLLWSDTGTNCQKSVFDYNEIIFIELCITAVKMWNILNLYRNNEICKPENIGCTFSTFIPLFIGWEK